MEPALVDRDLRGCRWGQFDPGLFEQRELLAGAPVQHRITRRRGLVADVGVGDYPAFDRHQLAGEQGLRIEAGAQLELLLGATGRDPERVARRASSPAGGPTSPGTCRSPRAHRSEPRPSRTGAVGSAAAPPRGRAWGSRLVPTGSARRPDRTGRPGGNSRWDGPRDGRPAVFADFEFDLSND